jgi:glycosyltransferase involved in cell wall biosynthesis
VTPQLPHLRPQIVARFDARPEAGVLWTHHGARDTAPPGGAYPWCIRHALRSLMSSYALAMRVARFFGRSRRPVSESGYEILLTGTFHSDNWVNAHLRPLAASRQCARLTVVSTYPVPSTDNVEVIYPPTWLRYLLGDVPARLSIFAWTAWRRRPHVVGGFHLLFNGLVAAILARLVGSRSVYFSVGGPIEVLNGGIWSENRLFSRLETPDPVIERRLIDSVAASDLTIAMGQRTVDFFHQRRVRTMFSVIPGGIDSDRFSPSATPPTTDLIWVGRLAAIKRVDLFLETVKHVKRSLPDVTATVMGDGPLREPLEKLLRSLQLDGNVTFTGQRPDVDVLLKRAKVFVLTSVSEGLALSLMEAMLCGLPAVVPLVGELPELVQDGVNGYLVAPATPTEFAARCLELLIDPVRLTEFGRAARDSAMRYETKAVTGLWDVILSSERFRSEGRR